MNSIQKRFSLFLLGCIPARLFLTYLSKNRPQYQIYLGYLALIFGISFLYLYITGSRKTGGEVFGDKIWWNNNRLFHGVMYLTFAYYALIRPQNSNAWQILLVDTIAGLLFFLNYHYKQGNFSKLVN